MQWYFGSDPGAVLRLAVSALLLVSAAATVAVVALRRPRAGRVRRRSSGG